MWPVVLLLCYEIEMDGYTKAITVQLLGKHDPVAMQQNSL
jgi:hypothetical protein